jgi:hypothetical protein
MPYIFVLPHNLVHVFLLSVLDLTAKILKEKQVQVDLICVLHRLSRVCRLANHPVSYLRVENFLTLDVMLVLQSTTIFNEVVENFYNLFRLQNVA